MVLGPAKMTLGRVAARPKEVSTFTEYMVKDVMDREVMASNAGRAVLREGWARS